MPRFNPRNYKKLGFVAIYFCAVYLIVYGGFVYYQIERLKEIELIYELRTLRNAVIIFKFMNGRNPESFKELAVSNFELKKGDKRRYIPHNISDNGFIDPFGGRYDYNEKSGWVKTSSADHAEW